MPWETYGHTVFWQREAIHLQTATLESIFKVRCHLTTSSKLETRTLPTSDADSASHRKTDYAP